MRKFRVYDIEWDTDGEEVDLPSEVFFDLDDEEVEEDENGNNIIADMLSDEYGWCVYSLQVEEVKK